MQNLFSAALALLLVYTAAGRAEELDAKKMLLAKKFDEYINSCEQAYKKGPACGCEPLAKQNQKGVFYANNACEMGKQRHFLLGLSASKANSHSRLRFPKSPTIAKILRSFLPYGGDNLQKRVKEPYKRAKKAIYYGLRARFIKRRLLRQGSVGASLPRVLLPAKVATAFAAT